MRILIEIGHPAHVHLFKNVIRNLENKGHIVKITAINKDIALALLDAYNFDYKQLRTNYKKLLKKAISMIINDFNLYKIANNFKPDIFVSTGSPSAAQVSKLLRKPHVAFSDTENANLVIKLMLPFTEVICTPSCFRKDLGKKQIRYRGYKELAYLHPNYFKPSPSVLEDLGLSKEDRYIILRFVSWDASHDIGQYGISPKMRAEYISKLEQYSKVFIVSEGELGNEFEEWKLRIAPEKFHSLLSYAQLYIGEGGSTATEAAILGTPSIHISTTAKYCGNFDDLHNNYNLIYTFSDDRQALEKALDILEDPESKKKWAQRRNKMLKEKIDVTAFMTNFIENYPESFYKLKEKERGG